ncbi:MAG: phosphotransferase family protein, partial [Nocardioidaceae bacterium]
MGQTEHEGVDELLEDAAATFGTTIRPLAGGYSGETFLVGDEGEEGDVAVLRIYARNTGRCVVDAALLRLLHGLVPVPRVLAERPAADGQPGVLVTERLPGERLDLVLSSTTGEQRMAMGRALGRVLARLSGVPQLRFGMFDGPNLTVSTNDLPDDGLTGWAQHYRDTGRLASWSEADWQGLLTLVDTAEGDLAGDSLGPLERQELDRVVLVHSDFNPKNVLVDTE